MLTESLPKENEQKLQLHLYMYSVERRATSSLPQTILVIKTTLRYTFATVYFVAPLCATEHDQQ